MQDIIAFECAQCKRKNYSMTKNKKQNPEKLLLSKFCKFCRKHTDHKELK
ncbi:MAG: 50S ribosomal protein L33 [Candidatus Omnitrophota bacterium]